MVSARVELRDLHLELAEFYSGFRGVQVPVNLWTQGVWKRIEALELELGVEG